MSYISLSSIVQRVHPLFLIVCWPYWIVVHREKLTSSSRRVALVSYLNTQRLIEEKERTRMWLISDRVAMVSNKKLSFFQKSLFIYFSDERKWHWKFLFQFVRLKTNQTAMCPARVAFTTGPCRSNRVDDTSLSRSRPRPFLMKTDRVGSSERPICSRSSALYPSYVLYLT